jgi:hypothetical protein
MLLVLPANAGAADLAPGFPPPQLHAQCPAPVYSFVPVLDQADPGAILLDVETWYAHAIDVSQREDVVFNPSQAYTWAEATKLSCGRAIGFLRSHELNALQLNECDCFYRRMIAHLN